MYTFLVLLISLLAILLCVIILIQSGKGGGLAASFGGAASSTESFMGGRQTATILTKLTWAGGAGFLLLALVLTVLSTRITDAPTDSVLWEGLGPSPEVPVDPTGVLEREAEEAPRGIPGTEEPGGVPPGNPDERN